MRGQYDPYDRHSGVLAAKLHAYLEPHNSARAPGVLESRSLFSEVRRDKNTKVLVGVFIRSDIPGADLDCDGAKASLQFAQDLSDMVGWTRSLPGVLPHLHQH